jgi:hypothetical protein
MGHSPKEMGGDRPGRSKKETFGEEGSNFLDSSISFNLYT